jgi:hypothetical protein
MFFNEFSCELGAANANAEHLERDVMFALSFGVLAALKPSRESLTFSSLEDSSACASPAVRQPQGARMDG